MSSWSTALALGVLVTACAGAGAQTPPSQPSPKQEVYSGSQSFMREQYPSTYVRRPNPPVVIRNVNILTAAGQELRNASIAFQDGKILAVGQTVETPAGATVIDGNDKWVTPGIIDTHSHLGVYAAPGTQAESDGNEATNPVTAEVWAEHSIWPHDPQIPLAIAGGVTMMQVLPGSANLIGGRSVTVRLVPARTVQEMKYPGAPYGVKMACGENPKRVYQNRGPSTRMGNMAGYRTAFIQAEQYRPGGMTGCRTRRAIRRPGISSWKRWPGCSAERSRSRTTATGPTRWPRCWTWPGNSASGSSRSTTASKPTRSRTCSRPPARRLPSGRIGVASRWRRTIRCPRTSR